MTGSLAPPFTFQLSADTNHSIRDVLLARGCTPFNPRIHSHCSLHWTTKQYTTPPDSHTTAAHSAALFNHFPHTANVTQKDALARTMRRLRAVYGRQLYSFSPLSFILPREKAKWYEAAAKEGERQQERREQEADDEDGDAQQLWIVKPSLSSQGRNISLVTDPSAHLVSSSPAVCQRYIGRPHLIGGHKYDLRVYVLVTSCRPLRAHLCRQGLCRFSSEPYTPLDTSNLLAHLTNSSLNKHAASFTKWTLARYLAHTRPSPAALHSFWLRLTHLVLLTLLPLVADVAKGGGCGAFELFGFDVLVDERGKLWLLEVNKSPAIAVASDEDRQVKLPMLNDLLDLLGVQRQAEAAVGVGALRREEECKEQMSFGGGERAQPMYGRRSSLSQRSSPAHSRPASSVGVEQRGVLKDVGCWHPIWPTNEREAELNESVSDERMRADRQPALLLSRYQQAIVDSVKQQRAQHRRQSLGAKQEDNWSDKQRPADTSLH